MTASLVLAQLVNTPDLVRGLRTLAPPAFSALVQRVGVEDAGPLLAAATTEQLVAAFDEDLFHARPGERETFDAARFTTWLEVLLEAGEAIAAQRVSELSEPFVVHAIHELVLVLDHEALLLQMDGSRAALRADKAIESSLSEELDGYLLIARRAEGWDAILSLVLALDRDHRAFLERVLDRCSALASSYVDDLDALTELLSESESVADDVLGEREARRAAAGYVEPQAARAFLALPPSAERDPITRAYFRELTPPRTARQDVPEELREALAQLEPERMLPAPLSPVLEALRELPPELYAMRLAELTYLANVLIAGARSHRSHRSHRSREGGRYTPHEASTEVLATIERALPGDPEAMARVLATTPCDLLFRRARATQPRTT